MSEMTIGEARTLAALLTGCQPEEVDHLAVIVFTTDGGMAVGGCPGTDYSHLLQVVNLGSEGLAAYLDEEH